MRPFGGAGCARWRGGNGLTNLARGDTSLVAIKGSKHGLTISLLEGPVPDVLGELDERLTRTASFFRGAQVTLNVENSSIGGAHLREVATLLAQHQIALRRLATGSPELAAAAAEMGLQIGKAPGDGGEAAAAARRSAAARAAPAPAPASVILDASEAGDPAIVLRRTIRSGTAIRHEGHIIIVGDVNPGAELIASGDVIVWGKLRGLVHAGATGDNEAIVCALHLEPTQLRIGNAIVRMPERRRRKSGPEMASVRDGKIEIVEWS